MDGFLLLDKPKGLSSGQCVSHIKKTLNLKKVGHCGTLDPLATGILPICIGEATKFSSYVSNESKEYKVNILFGVRTNTGDITGETLITTIFIYYPIQPLSVNHVLNKLSNHSG